MHNGGNGLDLEDDRAHDGDLIYIRIFMGYMRQGLPALWGLTSSALLPPRPSLHQSSDQNTPVVHPPFGTRKSRTVLNGWSDQLR